MVTMCPPACPRYQMSANLLRQKKRTSQIRGDDAVPSSRKISIALRRRLPPALLTSTSRCSKCPSVSATTASMLGCTRKFNSIAKSLPAEFGYLGQRRVEVLFARCRQRQIETIARQGERRGGADFLRGAGDKCDFS